MMKQKDKLPDRSIKVDWRTHRRLKLESARSGMSIGRLIAEWAKHFSRSRRNGNQGQGNEQTQ